MNEQKKPQAIRRDAKVAVYDDGSISFSYLHDQQTHVISFPSGSFDMHKYLADALAHWPDKTICAKCGNLIVADHAYPWRGTEYCRPCVEEFGKNWQCRKEAE